MGHSAQEASGTSSPQVEPATMTRADWEHDFRNALGNITISASAASSQAATLSDPVLSTALAEIEKGCNRCLKLLREMPR